MPTIERKRVSSMKTAGILKDKKIELIELLSKVNNKEFVCSVCGKICYSVVAFQYHMKSIHNVDIVSLELEGDEYKSLENR